MNMNKFLLSLLVVGTPLSMSAGGEKNAAMAYAKSLWNWGVKYASENKIQTGLAVGGVAVGTYIAYKWYKG